MTKELNDFNYTELDQLNELLQEKKEELKKYIEKNSEIQSYARSVWEKLDSNETTFRMDERTKLTKRFGFAGISICLAIFLSSVVSFIFSSAFFVPAVTVELILYLIAQFTNLFIASRRVDKYNKETDDAKTYYDNLKNDDEEAKILVETIDFLLNIINTALKRNDTLSQEYYKIINKIYDDMLNIKIEYANDLEQSSDKKELKVVSSRKKYSAQDKVLRIPFIK